MPSRLILVALAGLALAACQTAPPAEPVIRLAQTAETAPVAVAVPVSENLTEGLTENDWGGEVPQTRPSGAVSEGGLGDLD